MTKVFQVRVPSGIREHGGLAAKQEEASTRRQEGLEAIDKLAPPTAMKMCRSKKWGTDGCFAAVARVAK